MCRPRLRCAHAYAPACSNHGQGRARTTCTRCALSTATAGTPPPHLLTDDHPGTPPGQRQREPGWPHNCLFELATSIHMISLSPQRHGWSLKGRTVSWLEGEDVARCAMKRVMASVSSAVASAHRSEDGSGAAPFASPAPASPQLLSKACASLAAIPVRVRRAGWVGTQGEA